MAWYKNLKIAQLQPITQVATQIEQHADTINVAKSQFLKDPNNAKLWNTPGIVNTINSCLNKCWQAVVSAARAIKTAGMNGIVAAGESISQALNHLEQVCKIANGCQHAALQKIKSLVNTCYQAIDSI